MGAIGYRTIDCVMLKCKNLYQRDVLKNGNHYYPRCIRRNVLRY
jgi:hypothetical protein